jgi:hypothetical protein
MDAPERLPADYGARHRGGLDGTVSGLLADTTRIVQDDHAESDEVT